ncbi:MAG: S8 family serine peptidase [Novosphingobium sp.]|nr:S8 family serine peptidase [Novosphingobium sp.]
MLTPSSLRHLLLAVVIAATTLTGTASGQGRGGMPREIPFPRELPDRGMPDRLPDVTQRAAVGLERAEAAREQRLSKPQIDRAANAAKAAPADYELDRNGALAIRGEILATDLDAKTLARLGKAGFSVLRRDEVPDLGIALFVLSRPDMPATRALKRLRELDPDGVYELNHVFFESGRTASEAASPIVGGGRSGPETSVVGLIDTGVAQSATTSPQVRIVRRNFASGPGGGKPHGTAVAALLARKPGRVTIYAADVFGDGPRGGTTELLVRALGWMAQQKVPVVNVSMVGPPNRLVAAVTAQLIGRGFTIVAPVGNDGAAAKLLYPASYPGVIAVSAAGNDGRLLPEASRVKRVDFVAPGIAMVPDPLGRFSQVRGTSFAAPIVSRDLADYVTQPDPLAARRAVDRLASTASSPATDRSRFGRGLVGMPVSGGKLP